MKSIITFHTAKTKKENIYEICRKDSQRELSNFMKKNKLIY